MQPNDSCSGVWNVFHDATVVGMLGEVPGTLRLELDCDYLRDGFDVPGNRFCLTLNDCTRFAYRPWGDDSAVVTDLGALRARRLWIKSAERADGCCKVHCSEHTPRGNGGTLEVTVGSITVTLDGGKEISQSELERVAEEYWSGFELRPKHE